VRIKPQAESYESTPSTRSRAPTRAHRCEQLAQSCCLIVHRLGLGIDPWTFWSHVQRPNCWATEQCLSENFCYLRQGGYVFARLCLSVCLSVCVCVCVCVCVQNNWKSYGQIFLKFWGYVGRGMSYKWLNFGGDLAGILDSGSIWNFHYHCVKGGIKEPLAKRQCIQSRYFRSRRTRSLWKMQL